MALIRSTSLSFRFTMAAPLAKIPFILANTFAAYVSVRSPRPPPDSNEQGKYRERKETRDLLSLISWLTVPTFMVLSCSERLSSLVTQHDTLFQATSVIFGACDVYMILSTVYPHLHVSLFHRILLPSTARAPAVVDFYLTSPFVFGSLLLYIGTFLRYLCYRTLGRHFTFQLSLQKEHKLVTEGPYAFVRHPSYLGMTIALLGQVVAQMFSPGTWWIESGMWRTSEGQMFGAIWLAFSAFIAWALLSRVPKEDLMLKMEFKEEWMNWARKTRYAVIPYVW